MVNRQNYITLFLLLICTGFLSLSDAEAQTELNRVSAVERSDGNGFVVRFHKSGSVDSSRVLQPSEELFQVVLYSSDLDTSNFKPIPEGPVFRGFEIFKLEEGVAMNIRLHEGHYFNFSTYADQNGKDLLLALTNTTKDEMTGITPDIMPINWELYVSEEDGDEPDDFMVDENADTAEADRSNGATFDVVVIDAGHGGKDPGTLGASVREKDITLQVALRVGKYIEENIPDLKVVYTRTDNQFVGLEERGKIANKHDGDLFVSIHANAFDHPNNARKQSVAGAEIYFLGMARSQSALEVMKRENSVIEFESGEIEELTEEDLLIYELMNAGNMSTSQRIAEKVEHQFRERAQRKSRGVKQAGFQVLYEASMPGVLIELGFLSNPNEANYLTSEYGQSIIASAIYRSIRDFKLDYDRSYNRQTSSR